MARKKDAEEDFASKAILDQLQTKTVGAPPSTTGLTGDQLPETVFDVNDFDLVKNQVTLQLSNLELLNVLNTVGQITNTQSQSGPIPKTAFVTDTQVSGEGDGTFTLLQPGPGEVWEIQGGSCKTTNAVSVRYRVQVEDNNNSAVAEVADESVSANEVIFDPSVFPIYVDENIRFRVQISGTTSSSIAAVNILAVRVR